MEKEQYRNTFYGMKITDLSFSVPNSQDLRKQSHIQCINTHLYSANEKNSKKPAPYGVLDLKLGTSQKDAKCQTCGQGLAECVGHFGFIDLKLPVFHIGYFRFILGILQCICKKCSRVLLNPQDRFNFATKLQKPELSYLEKKALHKSINEKCKKMKRCLYCDAFNGQVKKLPLFKILHVNQPPVKGDQTKELQFEDYNLLVENNRDIEELIEKNKAELLDPIRVDNIFKSIITEDLQYLLIKNFNPSDLILWRVSVPPPCIRPSVINDLSGSNEDDLTLNLKDLLFISNLIHQHTTAGQAGIPMIMEHWEYLQRQYALYINSETPLPLHMKPKKAYRGLVQRLKGKNGRFRGNLSGKRVDFSARSVISPNPNLQIYQVGVPEHIAKILTYPEIVTPANIEKMRKLILNGADVHPGANFYQQKKTNLKIFLKYGNRKKLASEIKYGDVIERHLSNGDMVLFNRQPSLHKLSIMCHRAVVHKHRTFQFNECACTPYNADFDGDEMNLHLLQNEESRAEAYVLMGTKNNIITPRNGEPLIAAIQDFITGGYLLTQKDVFFDRKKMNQIIGSILSDYKEPLIIPPPAIHKPCALWTGKQIFNLIIKPSKQSPINVNLRTKSKNYPSTTPFYKEEMVSNDSFVLIKNSQLLSGAMDKTTLGSGSKSNIFYLILRDFGSEESSRAMWRLARVASYYLQNRGFSLGIDDVTPTDSLLKAKANLLQNGYTKVEETIQNLKDAQLESIPGLTMEESSESLILKELSVIRDLAGKECLKNLYKGNSALTMAICGSKGSFINVSQMVAIVGQQAIRGNRVPDGFGDRTLPHFDHNDKSAAAKGFVENSFYSGLIPTEFFFHTAAGREGLLDTAVKTAETGYMQRRLVKALEDLVAHYDGSVRNSRGDIIQFIYGDDGLDPVNMEENNTPANLERIFALTTSPSNLIETKKTSKDEEKMVVDQTNEEYLKSEQFKNQADDCLNKWSSEGLEVEFLKTVRAFLDNLSKRLEFSEKINEKYEKIQIFKITSKQLKTFLDVTHQKYIQSKLDPGTSIGCISAQSIGEPATQMTLKTFHFAGVASMNITQGVPRIKELMNAKKNISTPIITASLLKPHDREEARRVKMRIETTQLQEICEYIEQVVLPSECCVLVKLYLERISLLKLEVDTHLISILISKNLKIAPERIKIVSNAKLVIKANQPTELWQLSKNIGKIVVRGISSINRAAIRVDNRDSTKHYLTIEGEGLGSVFSTYGIDPCHTYSNNVFEMYKHLGIEAARSTIISEIMNTMQSHGISIDNRHLMLLADLMTYRGEVLGITRFGLAKMKESALMLASFEKTADHLFDAAFFGQEDPILGVSESIITGMPMEIGTGFFDLLYKPTPQKSKIKIGQHDLLFDNDEYHRPFSFDIDSEYAPS